MYVGAGEDLVGHKTRRCDETHKEIFVREMELISHHNAVTSPMYSVTLQFLKSRLTIAVAQIVFRSSVAYRKFRSPSN